MTEFDFDKIDKNYRSWLCRCSNAAPQNRQQVSNAVAQYYSLLGARPPAVVFCQSPWQMIMLLSELGDGNEYFTSDRDSPFNTLEWLPIWANLRKCMKQEITPEIRNLWWGDRDAIAPNAEKIYPPRSPWNRHLHSIALLWDKLHKLDMTLARQLIDVIPDQLQLGIADQPEHQSGLVSPFVSTRSGMSGQIANAIRSNTLTEPRRETFRNKPGGSSHTAFIHNYNFHSDITALPLVMMTFGRLASCVPTVLSLLDKPDVLSKLEPSAQKQIWVRLNLWEHAPFILAADDVCYVCEEPLTFSIDDRYELHCESGPALSFTDGWEIYSWHGISVPRQVIMSPETMTAEQIINHRNASSRLVMIERFGMARFITECNAQKIHEDQFGVLYRKEIAFDEPLTLVKVRNRTPEPDGTYREYFMRVPPTVRTAREAVAWTFDIPANEYNPKRET